MNTHELYIKRCIQIATNGLGTTYPNPLVGSVILHNNSILSEGWHRRAGTPHAEVHAINNIPKNKLHLCAQATLYVNLEPCCHHGKTPPCADLIINSGIKNVVIGTTDPNEQVAGKGIRKLKEAGVNVITDILSEECNALNRRFFTYHNKQRPYIILKWAQSQDGYMDSASAKQEARPYWISNPYSRQLTHRWRSEEQAILVGTQTAIADNPTLNTRDWKGNHPHRVLIDKSLRVSNDTALWDNLHPTTIYSHIKMDDDRIINLDFNQNILPQIMDNLYHQQIQSIIIEGGQQTLQSFIDQELWDEARVFTGAISLSDGLKAPVLQNYTVTDKKMIQNDTLEIFNHSD